MKFSPAPLFDERGKAVHATIRRKTGRGMVLPDHHVQAGTMNADEPTPRYGESVTGESFSECRLSIRPSGGWVKARQGAVAPCPEHRERSDRPRSGEREVPSYHQPAGGVSA